MTAAVGLPFPRSVSVGSCGYTEYTVNAHADPLLRSKIQVRGNIRSEILYVQALMHKYTACCRPSVLQCLAAQVSSEGVESLTPSDSSFRHCPRPPCCICFAFAFDRCSTPGSASEKLGRTHNISGVSGDSFGPDFETPTDTVQQFLLHRPGPLSGPMNAPRSSRFYTSCFYVNINHNSLVRVFEN